MRMAGHGTHTPPALRCVVFWQNLLSIAADRNHKRGPDSPEHCNAEGHIAQHRRMFMGQARKNPPHKEAYGDLGSREGKDEQDLA